MFTCRLKNGIEYQGHAERNQNGSWSAFVIKTVPLTENGKQRQVCSVIGAKTFLQAGWRDAQGYADNFIHDVIDEQEERK